MHVDLHVDRRPRSARRWARAARRVACVHHFDILGRSTGGDSPDPSHHGYELERVTTMAGPLADAGGEHDSWTTDLLERIGPVRRLMQARRTRRQHARFENGDVAYVATRDGAVVAWAWVSQAPTVRCSWSGLRFQLLPGDAYLYDLWSFPEHRKRGAGAFVMRGLLHDLAARGLATRAFGYVLRDNRESQVLHRLVLGFEQLQAVSSVRVLSHWAWQLPGSSTPVDGPCIRRWRSGGPDVVALRRGRAA